MKKVLFVFALCVAIVAANAQEKKDAPKKDAKAKTEQMQMAPKMGKTMIQEADLMKPIKEDWVKQVPGGKFERAIKMEKKDGDVYVLLVKKDNASWKLMYDKDGKFLNKNENKMPAKMEMKKVDEKKAEGAKVEEKKAVTPAKK